MTPSEERINRYIEIAREADAVGRLIGVKRLKISQQLKIEEMTPALDGSATLTTPDGQEMKIPRRSIPMIAAAVCEIDNVPIPFPRTRGELDAMMDRLDSEGFAAAAAAFGKLNPTELNVEGEVLSGDDVAKKSQGTTTS
jgi:hypothetical protein